MVKLACNNMHRINVSISQTRSGYEVINDAAERTMKNAQEVAEVSHDPRQSENMTLVVSNNW